MELPNVILGFGLFELEAGRTRLMWFGSLAVGDRSIERHQIVSTNLCILNLLQRR